MEHKTEMIPLSRPDIGEEEIRLVNEVLRTDWLSMGPKVGEFEKNFADYIGTEYAIAVNSGTSGLHLCMKSIGINKGDEVITAPFSFIASSNSIIFENGKPVFVDIDPHTLNIDAEKIEEAITRNTRAILPVHVFGQPCKMDAIMDIAEDNNLSVIEDACEAVGAEYNGRKAGTFGDASVFAFYPNKQMTTGEGGMIVTDNKDIAQSCISMRNQGRSEKGEWLDHIRIGYNYRLDEMSCALGIGQLKRINELLEKRSRVADEYSKQLSGIEGVKTQYLDPGVKMSWFVYVVQVGEYIDRNKVMVYLKEHGVSCRPYFTPIHLQPFYKEMFGYDEGDFPICEKVCNSTIALPFYGNMDKGTTRKVCNTLIDSLKFCEK
ncbi:MAG: aspartate aminotransferase [Candidatus Methanoperedens nitroreducens]|uniref:Aspartate aminotransferase n=1 Tax=Candidatus Methanoperedens nitratireducens TaxID=1392998 RepID=A0A0P8A5V5_9EURY|nr:DegT/DnrJ/EryC1/StrS family aminotransferase [Candidatus Methanoperedens sp. BLZ2]KPQ41949.1 MAG: aspartate aminotransferase [Candidatus Methanoperedens sp. BLZ1]